MTKRPNGSKLASLLTGIRKMIDEQNRRLGMPREKTDQPVRLFDPEQHPEPIDDDGTNPELFNLRGMEASRIRRGVMAAAKELRRTAVLDAPRDQPIQDFVNQPMAVPVMGHLNLFKLVQDIIDATADPETDQPNVITLPVQTLTGIALEMQTKAIIAEALSGQSDAQPKVHRIADRKFMGMPIVVNPSMPPNSFSIGYPLDEPPQIAMGAGSIDCPHCHRSMELTHSGTDHDCPSCMQQIYINLGGE